MFNVPLTDKIIIERTEISLERLKEQTDVIA